MLEQGAGRGERGLESVQQVSVLLRKILRHSHPWKQICLQREGELLLHKIMTGCLGETFLKKKKGIFEHCGLYYQNTSTNWRARHENIQQIDFVTQQAVRTSPALSLVLSGARWYKCNEKEKC